MSEDASFPRERKEFAARIPEAELLSDAALAELTAYRDRLRDEVHQRFSVRRTLSIEEKKDGREWTGARTEIGLLAGQVTTHERSVEKT